MQIDGIDIHRHWLPTEADGALGYALEYSVALAMTMMDRAEAQLNTNEQQMSSLRQERVFLAAQLEQARTAGPDAGSVRQLEEQYARMPVAAAVSPLRARKRPWSHRYR